MNPVKTTAQLVAAYKKLGSLKAIARHYGQNREIIRQLYHKALAEGKMTALRVGGRSKAHMKDALRGKLTVKPIVGGRRRAMKAVPIEREASGVSRFLFSCAQNNTKLHEGFWTSLLAMKDFYGAELHISRFAYIKSGLGSHGDKANYFEAQNSGERPRDFWFDERILPYVSDDRREVAPGLVWCGEANILPTAARPLSGLDNFTGRKSGIFPHVKIAMESIPSAKLDPVKFNYTTGTVTQRNYIHRKEGLKAEFHHCYGALLVEVENATGNWWCRQINSDSEGTIYDIDIMVKKGEVFTVNPEMAKRLKLPLIEGVSTIVEGWKWGDIHDAQSDRVVTQAIWGPGGIVDYTHPKFQFMDDTLDMFARNHHEMDDPVTLFQRYVQKKDNVLLEVNNVGNLFDWAARPYTQTIVVNSNHDRALARWLKDKRVQYDSTNVEFWHSLNQRVYATVRKNGIPPIILREAYLLATGRKKEPKGLKFLAQDDSFVICPNSGGGIECGQHGDDGPNGSRGTTRAFARIGRKINKDHDHTAAIIDSAYSAGCCLDLKNPPSYAHGPSSWSNSHIVTYVNGKRQIITQWGEDRKPWAARP